MPQEFETRDLVEALLMRLGLEPTPCRECYGTGRRPKGQCYGCGGKGFTLEPESHQRLRGGCMKPSATEDEGTFPENSRGLEG